MLWFRSLPLVDALRALQRDETLLSLQCRLHPRVASSQTAGDAPCARPQASWLDLPACGCARWRWADADARLEWSLPFDLSGGVYRAADVAAVLHSCATLLGADSLSHPNRLEVAGNQVLRRGLVTKGAWLACLNRPAMAVVTVNRVQDVGSAPLFSAPRRSTAAQICQNATFAVADTDAAALERLYCAAQRNLQLDERQYAAASSRFTSVHIGEWFLRATQQ